MIGVCFVYEIFVIQKLNLRRMISNFPHSIFLMFVGKSKNNNSNATATCNNNHQQRYSDLTTPHPQHPASKTGSGKEPSSNNISITKCSSSRYQGHICDATSLWNCSQSFLSLFYDSTKQCTTFICRTLVLTLTGGLLLYLRFHVMGSTLPVFTNFDNPASYQDFPTKQLTWLYLIAVNSWLLLSPSDLCCDWTMKTIPLVETLADPRNMATISTFAILIHVGLVAIFSQSGAEGFSNRHIKSSDQKEEEEGAKGNSELIFVIMALIVLPFLPASNLFFPVGFVVAERILYIPSMGFCMLVAYGFLKILSYISTLSDASSLLFSQRNLNIYILVLLVTHMSKTVVRNGDWKDEFSIFTSGIRVTNGTNAKLLNNVGHALEAAKKYKDALRYFEQATAAQPDDIGAFINVGRTHNNMDNFAEAEEAYFKARALLPQPRPGQPYTARIAPQHLSVFLNLGNLIAKKGSDGIKHLEEADSLYRQAIAMRVDYVQAYINRGDVLIKMGRHKEALEVYTHALRYEPDNPDLHYNLGVVYIELGEPEVALEHFERALIIDPEHIQALTNSAVLMQETGKPEFRPSAYQRLFLVLEKLSSSTTKNVEEIDGQNAAAGIDRIYFNLGMLGMDDGHLEKAEAWFKKAVERKPGFRSALFNLALLLNEQKRPLDALPFLKELLLNHPNHIKGLILLGDIYTNHVKDLSKAEECYKAIVSIDPTHIQGHHNLCVVMVEQGNLNDALICLKEVEKLAPEEEYVSRHIKIVESRIRMSEQGGAKK